MYMWKERERRNRRSIRKYFFYSNYKKNYIQIIRKFTNFLTEKIRIKLIKQMIRILKSNKIEKKMTTKLAC